MKRLLLMTVLLGMSKVAFASSPAMEKLKSEESKIRGYIQEGGDSPAFEAALKGNLSKQTSLKAKWAKELANKQAAERRVEAARIAAKKRATKQAAKLRAKKKKASKTTWIKPKSRSL